jgi:hypothetical protein
VHVPFDIHPDLILRDLHEFLELSIGLGDEFFSFRDLLRGPIGGSPSPYVELSRRHILHIDQSLAIQLSVVVHVRFVCIGAHSLAPIADATAQLPTTAASAAAPNILPIIEKAPSRAGY